MYMYTNLMRTTSKFLCLNYTTLPVCLSLYVGVSCEQGIYMKLLRDIPRK